jgi:hypothetical protein
MRPVAGSNGKASCDGGPAAEPLWEDVVPISIAAFGAARQEDSGRWARVRASRVLSALLLFVSGARWAGSPRPFLKGGSVGVYTVPSDGCWGRNPLGGREGGYFWVIGHA